MSSDNRCATHLRQVMCNRWPRNPLHRVRPGIGMTRPVGEGQGWPRKARLTKVFLGRGQPSSVDDMTNVRGLFPDRAPRPGLRLTVPLAALMIMVAACSSSRVGDSPADSADPAGRTPPSDSEASAGPSTAPTTTPITAQPAAAGETAVRIIVGD